MSIYTAIVALICLIVGERLFIFSISQLELLFVEEAVGGILAGVRMQVVRIG
ncbi:hypothetical protein BH10BAC6_BH10BAC6_11540 [soil metagenome]